MHCGDLLDLADITVHLIRKSHSPVWHYKQNMMIYALNLYRWQLIRYLEYYFQLLSISNEIPWRTLCIQCHTVMSFHSIRLLFFACFHWYTPSLINVRFFSHFFWSTGLRPVKMQCFCLTILTTGYKIYCFSIAIATWQDMKCNAVFSTSAYKVQLGVKGS